MLFFPQLKEKRGQCHLYFPCYCNFPEGPVSPSSFPVSNQSRSSTPTDFFPSSPRPPPRQTPSPQPRLPCLTLFPPIHTSQASHRAALPVGSFFFHFLATYTAHSHVASRCLPFTCLPTCPSPEFNHPCLPLPPLPLLPTLLSIPQGQGSISPAASPQPLPLAGHTSLRASSTGCQSTKPALPFSWAHSEIRSPVLLALRPSDVTGF